MSETINYEEWLAAINGANSPSADAVPLRAWRERLGMSLERSRKWLLDGLANGWMERALGTITEVNGRTRRIVCFRMVQQPKTKRKSA